MLSYIQLLQEKTYNIDEDVDYVYEKSGFDSLVNAVESKNLELLLLFKKSLNTPFSMSSSELKTEDAKQAHKLNPITIWFGSYANYGNYYHPSKNFIQFEPNLNVIDLYLRYGFDIHDVIPDTQLERFKKELTKTSLKGTIYHELTHWIDDSLHGGFLRKKTLKAFETKNKKYLIGKKEDVNKTDFEVNSQIHAIKQIKRDYDNEYEYLGWGDLFKIKSSLMSNFSGFKDESSYNKFINSLYSRLHREGLLTKKLIKEKPTWARMKDLLRIV